MKRILLTLLTLILLSTNVFGNLILQNTQSYSSTRPKTGTFLKDAYRNGYGILIIKNELNDEDAVCIISHISNPEIPLIAVYIRSKESFTIQGIEDGLYYLYFSLGEEWNSEQNRFMKNPKFKRFKDIFEFETEYVGNMIYYTVYEVTLYGVIGGKAETVNISEKDFPKFK
ncbi:MAG: hypothetical protein QXI58_08535 [Candidatus Micrarchaeia archaeon]